jgi:16S rRNA (cytidine1402-2'-O)-methyltransferase
MAPAGNELLALRSSYPTGGSVNGTITALGFMPGTLFVVATPIGNLEDITGRALRILESVSVIAAEDTRHTAKILARHAIRSPTTSLHEHNEAAKVPALVSRLQAGDDIALVTDAGTPTVSDPGQRLVRAALAAGIRVESVPGPSAPVAALAVSGMPGSTFTFLGFPPTKKAARTQWLDALASAGRTVIFFEAPHRIRQTLEAIQRRIGDRPVAVCRELTKVHEELVIGPISTALDRLRTPKGEFTVVIDLGQKIDSAPPGPPSDASVLAKFGELTEKVSLSRRAAVARLAQQLTMTPNDVYEAIERAKKLGEQ